MKAVYITEPGTVELKELPTPERRKGEALLRVLYGGICGSDLGSYLGTFAYFDYPRIPGHEFSAQIVEIEPDARGLKAGMVVTCNPYFNCGICSSCRRGLVNACMDNQTMGCQRDGAFCEYITMPLDRIIDGKGLAPHILAAVEPACIGYHGVQRADIRPGQNVLVVGGGTIGVLAAAAAKSRKAHVYLCDIPAARDKLERSQTLFGFDGIIFNDSPDALPAAVRKITGETIVHGALQANGFDVCIEAVGLPSTFQDCIDSACFGGKIVLIGVGKKNLDFNFTALQKKELNIMGSRNALTQDFIEMIHAVRAGEIDLEPLITDIYPFADAAAAFADFAQNHGTKLKVELQFAEVQ